MNNKENGSLTFEVWGCVLRAIKNIILPKIILTKRKDESKRWEKELSQLSPSVLIGSTALLFRIHEIMLLF